MKRFKLYIIVGLLFGIFDFHYQQFIPKVISSHKILFLGIWGIWLMPIIPIALYETKQSGSRLKSSFACMLTWSISIFSYYFLVPIKLIFIGQLSRPELYITNYVSQFYWSNLKSLIQRDVFVSTFEWLDVAIIGGGIIGFVVSSVYLSSVNFSFKKQL